MKQVLALSDPVWTALIGAVVTVSLQLIALLKSHLDMRANRRATREVGTAMRHDIERNTALTATAAADAKKAAVAAGNAVVETKRAHESLVTLVKNGGSHD